MITLTMSFTRKVLCTASLVTLGCWLAALPGVGWAAVAQAGPGQTSTGSSDQAPPPAAEKGKTVMGCLSGPDASGVYLLRSMQHRTGAPVTGAVDLKAAAGAKVKLTGTWKPIENPTKAQQRAKEVRQFEATQVEVVSKECEPPSATPAPKKK